MIITIKANMTFEIKAKDESEALDKLQKMCSDAVKYDIAGIIPDEKGFTIIGTIHDKE